MLSTINTQFDDLLNASYHQDGQKLLATNRYLQKRFDNPAGNTEIQKRDSNVSNASSDVSSDVNIQAIEIPTGANVSAEDIKL